MIGRVAFHFTTFATSVDGVVKSGDNCGHATFATFATLVDQVDGPAIPLMPLVSLDKWQKWQGNGWSGTAQERAEDFSRSPALHAILCASESPLRAVWFSEVSGEPLSRKLIGSIACAHARPHANAASSAARRCSACAHCWAPARSERSAPHALVALWVKRASALFSLASAAEHVSARGAKC